MHLKSEKLLPSLFSKRLTQFIFPGLREHLHFNMLVTLDIDLSSLLPIKCGKWYPPCFYWHFLLIWWHWASFQMFVIRVYSFVNCLFIFFCPFFILFAFFLRIYKSKSFAVYVTMISSSLSLEFSSHLWLISLNKSKVLIKWNFLIFLTLFCCGFCSLYIVSEDLFYP